ncbi:MAG: hypothetical protein R6X32_08425 [Chloroflexota bacterium]
MTDMNYKEMQELMNGFIDRSSSQYDEMPATSFLELLFEQMAPRHADPVSEKQARAELSHLTGLAA